MAFVTVTAIRSVGVTRGIGADHRVSVVDVGSDVKLEVLDWGGSGPSLILLAGLDNTAHVFDEVGRRARPES